MVNTDVLDGDGDAESDDYDTMEIQSVESNDYGGECYLQCKHYQLNSLINVQF